MISSLEQQIREHLARFVDGRITMRQFDAWFSPATLTVERMNDRGAEDLTWEIMLRLAEYSNGDRGLAETKAVLRDFAHRHTSVSQTA